MLLLYLDPDPPPLPPRQLKKHHPKSLPLPPLPSVESPLSPPSLPPPVPPRGEYDSAPSGLCSRFPLTPYRRLNRGQAGGRYHAQSQRQRRLPQCWETGGHEPRSEDTHGHTHTETHTHALFARPLLFSIYQQLQARRTCRCQ